MSPISQRLFNQLSISCRNMDDGTIEALSAAVRSGQLPWFVGEFRTALDGAITIPLWRQVTALDIANDDRPLVEKHVRQVWTAVEPNEPFPGMRWS